MSKSLSLIIFDVGGSPVAVSAESVSSFIPLENYGDPIPSGGFSDFIVSSGIATKDCSRTFEEAGSFVMVVNNNDGTNTCYLTPPPRELIEYELNELYPLPEFIEKVSPLSNVSGYCLHKGMVVPILQPKTGCD